mmetsp:Transcript_13287/g.21700  ORF Transcript_13287/g.21700 Transcript_13287/m.21700 type:complete len:100 (-) Transcript_13287:60-359(-)
MEYRSREDDDASARIKFFRFLDTLPPLESARFSFGPSLLADVRTRFVVKILENDTPADTALCCIVTYHQPSAYQQHQARQPQPTPTRTRHNPINAPSNN